MTERKFYKTQIIITVLSEGTPYEPAYLSTIHEDITSGDCSGQWDTLKPEELNGKQAADALVAQDSDPGFFNLDDEGNDLEED